MSQLGLGVMINLLKGNEETVNAINSSLNKEIKNINIEDDNLILIFKDDSKLRIWDNGQSCCELRFMNCDDDLKEYLDSKLIGFDLKSASNKNIEDDNYSDEHEIQFLDVHTSKGIFTISNHNVHNGYYGGFCIEAELIA